MKFAGPLIALAGLALAVWLVWHADLQAVLGLMRAAGAGLVLAGIAHVLPMIASARDWQLLMRGTIQPKLIAVLGLVWIRESVNGMLPVARVGGEVVTFRMMHAWGMEPPAVLASFIVDIQLTLISQALFAGASLAWLLGSGAVHLPPILTWGIAASAPTLVVLSLVLRANPFRRLSKHFNRIASGKVAELVDESEQVEDRVNALWHRRGIVTRYLLIWQSLQCITTALEVWLALYFLGAKTGFVQALVIESLVQALSSIAFFVPGAVGVQEGGFLLIGTALGLNPQTCIALAFARRIRDLVVFLPGLVAWQVVEWRHAQRS
ncbi:lysylphosphatidylglycerol synthase domain-containing protein [Paraburkholderia tagetis]|uniref:Lysylphosphatidylglycerol synthase domain-containing protein n=1 Tax=Paraburkholderia tagetis TaxID=2913261 RepID=A0A9X1RPU5_9BURK|nr:lysylphosphatidylglycerol synthase domain-containing protein [Paraburkholderia tagetis]MCG5074129.1 lysylphosphatidylglycerol synthase domain-containing protein [Paraburkholderia tagetis]